MKCSLGTSNFLEKISSLSHSIVFLYFFSLITEEGFLISLCYSLEHCIQMGISFLFLLLFASLLFTAIFVKLLCGKQKLINVHGFSEKCLKWGSKVLFNSLWFFSFYHECINWYFSYNSRWAPKYYEDSKWSYVIPNLEPRGLSSEDWLWDTLNFTEVF